MFMLINIFEINSAKIRDLRLKLLSNKGNERERRLKFQNDGN